ncbi:hypothetical protein DFA_10347 [Cavenderia fasciculata]|uniref:Integrase catalytic domain-containing protein n=1 Tax=Cavenderia fasciculata TaxID=261658 RepID=F4Q9Y7_CACFS|nr:uncharacterized protein DFA_10347 [Cavenderia fasciculata]EGG15506.1 hypothetical protein DFA_10347 [Cavenderia fasciculata]|eukprot:XP_004354248.1 hypothetical protein DFA_10347 [Cavenderia fasciculata]
MSNDNIQQRRRLTLAPAPNLEELQPKESVPTGPENKVKHYLLENNDYRMTDDAFVKSVASFLSVSSNSVEEIIHSLGKDFDKALWCNGTGKILFNSIETISKCDDVAHWLDQIDISIPGPYQVGRSRHLQMLSPSLLVVFTKIMTIEVLYLAYKNAFYNVKTIYKELQERTMDFVQMRSVAISLSSTVAPNGHRQINVPEFNYGDPLGWLSGLYYRSDNNNNNNNSNNNKRKHNHLVNQDLSKIKCFNCQRFGHKADVCRDNRNNQHVDKKSRDTKQCNICRSSEHWTNQCPRNKSSSMTCVSDTLPYLYISINFDSNLIKAKVDTGSEINFIDFRLVPKEMVMTSDLFVTGVNGHTVPSLGQASVPVIFTSNRGQITRKINFELTDRAGLCLLGIDTIMSCKASFGEGNSKLEMNDATGNTHIINLSRDVKSPSLTVDESKSYKNNIKKVYQTLLSKNDPINGIQKIVKELDNVTTNIADGLGNISNDMDWQETVKSELNRNQRRMLNRCMAPRIKNSISIVDNEAEVVNEDMKDWKQRNVTLQPPNYCFQRVHIDVITGLPNAKYHGKTVNALLVVVDALSKMNRLIPTTTTLKSHGVISLFNREIFKLHGLPKQIISDSDSKFTSKLFKKLEAMYNIKINHSNPTHHQSNGQVEHLLQSSVENHKVSWAECIDNIEFAINNTVHSTTGYSPFTIYLGSNPLSPLNLLDTFTPNFNDNTDIKITENHKLKEIIRDIVIKRINEGNAISKARYDHNKVENNIKSGDLVYVRRDRDTHINKTEPIYSGPLLVNGVDTRGNVEVKDYVAGADGSTSKDLLVNPRFIKTLKPLLATGNPVHTEGAENAQGNPVHTEGAENAQGYPVHTEGAEDAQSYPVHTEGTENVQGYPVHTEGTENVQDYPVHTEGAQGARDNLDGRVGDDRTLYQDLNKIQSTLQGQGVTGGDQGIVSQAPGDIYDDVPNTADWTKQRVVLNDTLKKVEESIGKGKNKLQVKDNNRVIGKEDIVITNYNISKINYDDIKINFIEILHQYRQQLSSPTTTKYFNMKEMNSIRIIQSLQQNNNDSPTKDIVNSIGVITSRAWLKPLFIVKSKRTFKYQGNGRSRTEYLININDCEVWMPNDLVNQQHVRAVSKTQQVSLAIVSTAWYVGLGHNLRRENVRFRFNPSIFNDNQIDWLPPHLENLYVDFIDYDGEQGPPIIRNLPYKVKYLVVEGELEEIYLPQSLTTLAIDSIQNLRLLHGLSNNKNLTTLLMYSATITPTDSTFRFPDTLTNLFIEDIKPPTNFLFRSSLIKLSFFSQPLISLDNLQNQYPTIPVIKNLHKLKHLNLSPWDVQYRTFDFPPSLETLELSHTNNIYDIGNCVLLPSLKEISIHSNRRKRLPEPLFSSCTQLETLKIDIGNADRFHYLESIQHLTIFNECNWFESKTPIRLPKNLVSLKSYCNLNLQLSLPPTLTKLCVPRFTGITSFPSSIRFLRMSTKLLPNGTQCFDIDNNKVLPSNVDKLDLDLVSAYPLRIDDILFQTNVSRLNIYKLNQGEAEMPFYFQIRRLSKDSCIILEKKRFVGGIIQFK